MSNTGKHDSGYAMALLPLACEPLEYLNGRLGKEHIQQDKVNKRRRYLQSQRDSHALHIVSRVTHSTVTVTHVFICVRS